MKKPRKKKSVIELLVEAYKLIAEIRKDVGDGLRLAPPAD